MMTLKQHKVIAVYVRATAHAPSSIHYPGLLKIKMAETLAQNKNQNTIDGEQNVETSFPKFLNSTSQAN